MHSNIHFQPHWLCADVPLASARRWASTVGFTKFTDLLTEYADRYSEKRKFISAGLSCGCEHVGTMFTERDQKLVGEYWTHRKGHNRGKVGPRRWIVCYEHKMVFYRHGQVQRLPGIRARRRKSLLIVFPSQYLSADTAANHSYNHRTRWLLGSPLGRPLFSSSSTRTISSI